MIKVTLVEVMNSIESLKSISDMAFDFKTSVEIAKIVKELDVYVAEYEKTRNSLVKEYGSETEVDGQYQIDNVEGFNKKHSELLNETVELDYDKIDIKKFEELDSIKPKDLIVLDWLIDSSSA